MRVPRSHKYKADSIFLYMEEKMSLKSHINEIIPNFIFPFIAIPFWLFHPHRECFLILPSSNCWMVIKRNDKLYVPSPKVSQRLFNFVNLYERDFYVEEGETVLDVGACVGAFARSVAGKAKRIVAIEPEPDNVVCLRKNVQEFENVDIIQKGVWSKKGYLNLNLSWGIEGHSITKTGSQGSVNIQVDSIDNIVSDLNIEKVDFIKMNVEGAEIEALEGAKKTLKNTEKISVASYYQRNGKITAPRVRDFLDSQGFNVSVSEKNIVYARKRTD